MTDGTTFDRLKKLIVEQLGVLQALEQASVLMVLPSSLMASLHWASAVRSGAVIGSPPRCRSGIHRPS